LSDLDEEVERPHEVPSGEVGDYEVGGVESVVAVGLGERGGKMGVRFGKGGGRSEHGRWKMGGKRTSGGSISAPPWGTPNIPLQANIHTRKGS